jgi:hypothetical protein
MVPHVAARKTHQRLLKFSFVTPKRLLQQNRHEADIASGRLNVCYWEKSGHQKFAVWSAPLMVDSFRRRF